MLALVLLAGVGVAVGAAVRPGSGDATSDLAPGARASAPGAGGGALAGGTAGPLDDATGGAANGAGLAPEPSGAAGPAPSRHGTVATARQTRGVVVVQTEAAGGGSVSVGGATGVVLASGDEVVTNAHVVDGTTRVTVVDPSTGVSYPAKVVGRSDARDLAVLRLVGSAALTPAVWDRRGGLAVGDHVTAIGNAGDTGVLVAAPGTVDRLRVAITTSHADGSRVESLSGLVRFGADVVPGDSGGPVLDADGAVAGIVVAATSGETPVRGFAIPAVQVLTAVHKLATPARADS